MPTATAHRGVFVSCVSDEFEKPGAAFPGLRSALRHYLTRANCPMVVQEDFPLTAVDTVEKLDGLIRGRAAVLHLVGEKPGATANPKAVAAYLKAVPDFLDAHPDVKAALGDFSDLTYTQWEAFLALHHNVPLFVYATDGGAVAQGSHLKRLEIARRYASAVKNDTDLFGQLIGDIHGIVASVPKFEPKRAPSKLTRHAARNFFGREQELALLDEAWKDTGVHVLSIVAWGGVGKTSLVSHWVATRFAAAGWPGVERYFDWSFYSQGTGDSRQTSSDLFIHDALTFFGDTNPTAGSTWDRGERLARLIRRQRTLLVLDGIEPLQYPPTDRSGQAGRLKDQGLEALLQSLTQENNGLCVVTTREHLANIDSYPTQREHKLDKLLLDAAVSLIRHLQLLGSDEEIAEMWDELGGHALSILQLGRLLTRAYGRDLRRWREIGFQKADKLKQGRSTIRVMEKYEAWLRSGSKEQQLELAVLRLMGLFDRPMSADCFHALRQPPPVAGLTDLLAGVEGFELELAITTLIENDLQTHVSHDDLPRQHLTQPLDAHPLIREYFGIQLKRDQPEAFKAAHSRLFDHLCATTPHQPDTLDGLQPLYQAVAHGCLAGRQQEAYDDVYFTRILRGTGEDGGFYSTRRLGAIGTDLAAVAAFFDEPWDRVCPHLRDETQGWLLRQAAVRLQSLGRLTEALHPFRASLEVATRLADWTNAARRAANLSQVEVALGRLEVGAADARWAINAADQSANAAMQILCRTKAADALHQFGSRAEAGKLFHEAEVLQQGQHTRRDMLFSLDGSRYGDWLLAPVERAAWRSVLCRTGVPSPECPPGPDDFAVICDEVERRGRMMFEWRLPTDSLLAVALDYLMLARVGLVRAILADQYPQPTLNLPHVADAANGLRNAGTMDHLPKGLLTAALYHFVRGEEDAACARLDEAQQIAERGPMPLHLADVHLHRARLFRDRSELAKAAKLIRDLGYGRRYDELADAEAALGAV